MARTAKQRAAQLKAAKVSAAKRRKLGLNRMEKKDIGAAMQMYGTVRNGNRTWGVVNGSDKERAMSKKRYFTGKKIG